MGLKDETVTLREPVLGFNHADGPGLYFFMYPENIKDNH
jgi:hypothetical protein